jgi:hypothetical protein
MNKIHRSSVLTYLHGEAQLRRKRGYMQLTERSVPKNYPSFLRIFARFTGDTGQGRSRVVFDVGGRLMLTHPIPVTLTGWRRT